MKFSVPYTMYIQPWCSSGLSAARMQVVAFELGLVTPGKVGQLKRCMMLQVAAACLSEQLKL